MSVISALKKIRANKKNYGAKRSTSDIKYIVIHYTGNDGDSDTGNANYFKNNVVKASAHYFVDSDSITQSVPDNYVAWSVGGTKYADCKKTGGGNYYNICKNANSISIELCDDKKNGKVYPTDKTIENALLLTRYLMKKYNVPQSRVIRHFDVTGKVCPAYWCATEEKNRKWKTAFWNKIPTKPKATTTFKVKTKRKLCIYENPGTGKTGRKTNIDVYTITKTASHSGMLYGHLKIGGWIKIDKKYVERL